MCATEATLALRASRRAQTAIIEAATQREAANHYAERQRQAQERKPNPCRMVHCDACNAVFPETEGMEGRASGYLGCPDCGMDVA